MQIHARRAANEWSRKSSIPEGMTKTVKTVETMMEVLEELPNEWVATSKVHEMLSEKDGVSVSRRTARRWINKLDQEDYLMKRGKTRNTQIYPMVEGKNGNNR